MGLFELVIALLFAGALFALWAGRIGVPYPALLALVGAIIALVPVVPTVGLDPELALALFVAPTLLDTAYDASPRDLRDNLGPVVGLAVVMVLVVVAAVAWAARRVVPDLGWAAAVALGAIVAPPDASAASAVLRTLRPPHRLMVILEGESLFNDATALLIYRVAVGAAVTGAFSGWTVVPTLLLTCGGGVIAGWAMARVNIVAMGGVRDIPISVLLQFISTFAVWIVADLIGLSAIITMVAYAMTLARRVGGRMGARHRIASYAVWDVVVLVLNVLAFVLIGLQMRGIVARVHPGEWGTYARAAGAVCAAVVLARIGWILTYTAFERWRTGRRRTQPLLAPPTARNAILAAWCGMRGIVTLAAALALPRASFPHRDLLVFCAFSVVLVTLVVQGLTLRPLMRWLGVRDEDGAVEREIGIARVETTRAALRALETEPAPAAAVTPLRREYEARLQAAEAGAPLAAAPDDDASTAAVQQRAVLAQREVLRDLRARRVIGDDAFHVVEEEIDLLELTADPRVRPTLDGDE